MASSNSNGSSGGGSGFNPLSLLTAPISGAFSYASDKAKTDAENNALKVQTDYNNRALADAEAQRAWQRQQYNDYLTRTEPYRQYGEQAGNSLSQLLARGPGGQIPSAQQLALPASSVGNLAAK